MPLANYFTVLEGQLSWRYCVLIVMLEQLTLGC